jgi:uncharacterized protein DUF6602
MANRAKQRSESDGRSFLRESLAQVERQFLLKLDAKFSTITHDPTLGDAVEDSWINLLKAYLPKRYCANKAFAIDHKGRTTQQIDCLIYDAHFTPALFGEEKHLYVPAEAIYAAFEIKPAVTAEHLKYAAEKGESVRRLTRTSAAITWGPGRKRRKRLFPVLTGLLAMRADWGDGLGATFRKRFDELKGDRALDCVLTARNGFCDRFGPRRRPTIACGEGTLIRGLFRLLSELREKATVPAIDWDAYEDVLRP